VSVIPLIEHSDLMLATLHPAPFSGENWIFELKYDGFRCLVRKVGSRVELLSRNGKPLNKSFPDVVAAIERLPGSFVWDAELTVDEPTGRSSFERLQLRARTSMARTVRAAAKLHPARLYIFDLLAAGHHDLRELPLIQRKEMLRDTFDDTATLVYVTGIVAAGAWVFDQAVRHDFEGMIGKRLDSPYQRGRSNYWHKVKNQGYSRPAALGWGRNSR
jgi:bifunctional non-homologous end joining protein LigD